MYTRIKAIGIFVSLIFSIAGVQVLFARQASADDSALKNVTARPLPTPEKSSYPGYKGINIGATTTDVRTKLGNPKDKSDTMDLFMFGETETVQFYYDAERLVTAIMMNYTGDLKTAPTPKDILGEDVAPGAEGGVFKMVKYPKSGFWISYNRTPGADAMVIVAIQKM